MGRTVLRAGALLMTICLAACQTIIQTVEPQNMLPRQAATELFTPLPIQLATATPTSLPPAVAGYPAGTVIVRKQINMESGGGAEQILDFDAPANQIIRADVLTSGGSLSYQMLLRDKFGNTLAAVTSDPSRTSESIAEFMLPFEGSYQLAIVPTGGTATLQVTVSASEAATGGGLSDTLPMVANGKMTSGGVYHTYQFGLEAGQTVSIVTMPDTLGSPRLRLMLITPDGRIAQSADSSRGLPGGEVSLRGIVALQTGLYAVIVSNEGQSTGNYSFSVTLDTDLPTPEDAASITYNKTYPAAFTDQSILRATFDGKAGDALRVALTNPSSELQIAMYLYNPYDEVIAYENTSSAGQEAALNEIQLPWSGRYRLELRPTGSGQGTILVTQLPASALTGGGAFGDDDSGMRSGMFRSPAVFHYYQFNGHPGDTVSISLGVANDGYGMIASLVLVAPNGEQIAFDDGATGSAPSISNFGLSQAGTYTIVVYSANGKTGSYDLDFQRVR